MQLPSGRVSTGLGPDAPEFSMSPGLCPLSSSYWSWDAPVSLGAGLLVVVGAGLLVVVGAGLLVVVGAGLLVVVGAGLLVSCA